MASTKDLSDLTDREMWPGQGPFLNRICQDAGMLPKAKRGGWRAMEQLTAGHLADYLIGVAGTRPAGERNTPGAIAAFKRYALLTCDWGGKRGRRTLREDLENLISQLRDKDHVWDDFLVHSILFISDERRPEVEIRLSRSDGADPGQVLNYIDPKNEADPGSVREAVVIGGELLVMLGELLREPAYA